MSSMVMEVLCNTFQVIPEFSPNQVVIKDIKINCCLYQNHIFCEGNKTGTGKESSTLGQSFKLLPEFQVN